MKKKGILTLLITTVIYPTPQRAVDFGNKLGVSIDNMLHGIFWFLHNNSVSRESHCNLDCYQCG